MSSRPSNPSQSTRAQRPTPLVQRFPPEVLSHIFSQIPDDFGVRNGRFRKSRQAELCSVAVVCQSWTGPAREQLHKTVVLYQGSAAAQFASSSNRHPGLRTTNLEFPFPDNSDSVLQVIEACRGLKNLKIGRLSRPEALDVAVFENAALAELTELRMTRGLKFKPTRRTTFSLPFKLTKAFLCIDANLPVPLLSALLQPNLTTIQLNFERRARSRGSIAESYLVAIETNLASTVTDLTIRGLFILEVVLGEQLRTLVACRARVARFMSRFSGLKTFHCDLDELFLASPPPTSLESLNVLYEATEDQMYFEDGEEDLEETFMAWSQSLVAFVGDAPNLKHIDMDFDMDFDDQVPQGSVLFEELQEICTRKGIRCDWVGDWKPNNWEQAMSLFDMSSVKTPPSEWKDGLLSESLLQS